MNKTIQVKDLRCDFVGSGAESRIVFMIYPEVELLSAEFLDRVSKKYNVAAVAVYVPADQWNNYLTPWPEPPESAGFAPFLGKADLFRTILETEIVPHIESSLGFTKTPERFLVGVSLSGLFTLWQWMLSDVFNSIGSLSGSFWYEGFLKWFDEQPVPTGKGKAYFLLGIQEPHAKIKAYQSVGVNTEAVIDRLRKAGIPVTFDWVPGNHFSEPVHRLEKALASLLS